MAPLIWDFCRSNENVNVLCRPLISQFGARVTASLQRSAQRCNYEVSLATTRLMAVKPLHRTRPDPTNKTLSPERLPLQKQIYLQVHRVYNRGI